MGHVLVRRSTITEEDEVEEDLDHHGDLPCRCHARIVDVAEVIHDIKSPLGTIALELGALDAALMSSDLRTRLSRMSRNVAYINRLVHELLDASICENTGLALHRQPTDLQQMLECVLRRAVAARDAVRMRLVAPQPVWADVDAFRIERVVCNLVDNALRYSPEHTGVVVRLERRDDDVRVSVADQGPGLSDDIAAALFASLGRRAPGGDIGGHGIGLRVSKRIIDAHGGTLAVHSTPGVGSTFYFDLPLR